MEVTGKVQVDVLHGDDLGIAAASSAALDTKHRAQGGLTQGNQDVLAQLPHAIGQTNSGGGLAFTGRGGVDGGDENQLTIGTLDLFEDVVVNLCLVLAVLL